MQMGVNKHPTKQPVRVTRNPRVRQRSASWVRSGNADVVHHRGDVRRVLGKRRPDRRGRRRRDPRRRCFGFVDPGRWRRRSDAAIPDASADITDAELSDVPVDTGASCDLTQDGCPAPQACSG